MHKSEMMRRRKRMQRMMLAATGIAVVAAVVLILLNRPEATTAVDYSDIAFAPPVAVTATAATDADAPPAVPSSPKDVSGAVLGDPDARVTMVIYADYQCPFCKQFFAEVHPKIVDDFVRPGKVRVEYREFPVLGGDDLTNPGNESVQAAEAAMCAAEQDAYLEYHDTLYANQASENEGAFTDDRLKDFARDMGLDTERFDACLDNGIYEIPVIQSRMTGDAIGISGTPMFIVNGQITQYTVQGYDLLEKQLNAALVQAES